MGRGSTRLPNPRWGLAGLAAYLAPIGAVTAAGTLRSIDRIAANDQARAYILASRARGVSSAVTLCLAHDRLKRRTTHRETSIDHIAHSYVKLALSRRRLGAL